MAHHTLPQGVTKATMLYCKSKVTSCTVQESWIKCNEIDKVDNNHTAAFQEASLQILRLKTNT